MRNLFLGAFWAVVSVAPSAQGSEFYPLGAGDTWTYERLVRNPYPSALYTDGLRHVTAGADTTIDGAAYRLMDVQYTDYAGTTTGTARCAARVAGAAEAIVWVALRGACGALEAGLEISQGGAPAPATYYVGGLPYEGVARQTTYRVRLAAGLGVVESEDVASGMSPVRRNHLLHATVGGVTVGTSPDPAAWHSYYSLAVGDRHVTRWAGRYSSGHTSRVVVGEETIGGVVYMRVHMTSYDAATVPAATGTATTWERYRDDLGCAVQRQPDGSEACVTPTLGGRRTTSRTATTTVAGQTVTARVIEVADGTRNTTTMGSFSRYVEGIGEAAYNSWNTSGPSGGHYFNENLVYAFVSGVGTGAEPGWAVWPTADEPGPGLAPALALRLAGSNPTAGPVRLRADSAAPRTVRLTVTDVLGRIVEARDVTLGAGTTDVQMDFGGHAAGRYRVQMRDAAGTSAAVSVVRR